MIFIILLSIISGLLSFLINFSRLEFEKTLIFSVATALLIFAILKLILLGTKKITYKSTVGIAAGLGVSTLIFFAASEIINTLTLPEDIYPFVMFVTFATLLSIGIFIGLFKTEDFSKTTSKFSKDSSSPPKILDTSVIIDGRIADVAEVGFIEGEMIIPKFIIKELQYIADSSEATKRVRGRRGLDVLKKMQNDIPGIVVKITGHDFPDIREADLKLVELAKKLRGTIITNDFNLNKVAGLQGVKVLNLNELSNSLKPVVLPGEMITISLVKEGKEHNQAIGYLDDGTMVVVDDAKPFLGNEVEVTVTSVLQTSTGRMVFAKTHKEDIVSNLNA